jgi:UDP-glucuronate decarboxylase
MRNRETVLRVLVTGGAGFIGSHLCDRLLHEGHDVVCLDNFLTGSIDNLAHLKGHARFTVVEQDVCDPLDDALPRFDEIYNLACPASPPHYQAHAVATMRTCSEGTRTMLDRALIDGARLFHASTSEIYGDPLVHPQVEIYTGNVHTIGPRACYDEGKRFAESLVHIYALQQGVDAKIARLFNTYGPRMQVNDGRLISNVVVQALMGEDVTVYGDGTHTRSLCYVDDTVEGILRLTRSEVTAGTPVNIGNPVEMRVIDIVARVLRATGGRSRVRHLPLPLHDPARRLPDIERAISLLGWRPTVPLTEGLTQTIAYFEDRLGVQRSGLMAAG